jgi:hypothetical protein
MADTGNAGSSPGHDPTWPRNPTVSFKGAKPAKKGHTIGFRDDYDSYRLIMMTDLTPVEFIARIHNRARVDKVPGLRIYMSHKLKP